MEETRGVKWTQKQVNECYNKFLVCILDNVKLIPKIIIYDLNCTQTQINRTEYK